MNKIRTFFVLCLIFGQISFVSGETLSMYIWSKDLSPIISLDPETSKYRGIVLDVLAGLPAEHQVNLKINLHNRKRGEADLYSGEVDFTILPKEWLGTPDKLIFSYPIYVLKDFLYATKAIPNLTLTEIVKKRFLCTRRNYIYPKLSSIFDDKVAFRMDSNTATSQFGMLLRGRCDFVVINELVGKKVINKNLWQNQIIRSEYPFDAVDFTFAFHPTKAGFLVHLNKHIAQLRSSGELQKIIDHHRNID